MIVVDTNVIAYLYLTGDQSDQAELLLESDPDWNVPVLWKSEIRSVLSRYLRKNILSVEEVLFIIRQAEELLANNVFEVSSAQVMKLVNSSNCSSYDCEFVALAQYLSCALVTADKKIIREFPDTAVSLGAMLDSY
jgi:predicted nucleic acid-binding protein